MKAPLVLSVVAVALVALSGCLGDAGKQSIVEVPAADPLINHLRDIPAESSITKIERTGEVRLPSALPVAPAAPPRALPDYQTSVQKFTVTNETFRINATLTWSMKGPTPETSDLDLWIYDAEGKLAGLAASLADPEAATMRVRASANFGEWTALVVNYNNPPTTYNLVLELMQ